jgi:RsiW-degrading membrane proteinase PrsW (M82 family)
VWRTHHFEGKIDGVVFAAAAALGFITAHNLLFASGGVEGFVLCRAASGARAPVLRVAGWGLRVSAIRSAYPRK